MADAGRAISDAKRASADSDVEAIERAAREALAVQREKTAKPTGKVRPRTAHELETCLRAAIQREQGTIWNPGGSFAAKEGREFLEGFGDQLEAALPDIEAKIEIFAKDKTMNPWTVAKFSKSYNGIGQSNAGKRSPPPFVSLTVEDLIAVQEEKRNAAKRR